MKVLITGGAGYIGSTIASCCADNGIDVVILDDLSRGLRAFGERFDFYEGDIADEALLERLLTDHPDIEAVIHCAAKIVVPESVAEPIMYYDNNVAKPMVLLNKLHEHGVGKFILSSTASMYAPDADFMVDETSALEPNSPYSASKFMLERVLADYANTGAMQMLALRYFNPIGADPQLRTGLQDPHPTHVLGKMIEALHSGQTFTVTGVDWPTRDGSGLRDYIHVWDLARAHVAALHHFDRVMAQATKPNYDVINLGTGLGTTVFEFVAGFNEAMGVELDVATAPPRPGDVPGCATRTAKANELLEWETELSIAQGVRDSVAWSEKLPALLED
ncbi:UDP-glucose 4-epimerase GalE [Corynebacterium sp. 13CS0277]|uniref:UDP-glucose 4-epimerase GalE n=1 Tax=Corynebacterium sp. 13CS0277 TaxID=2071994 RepID=UPI000D03EB47|nr:UDP-glucose 4-epimerase GalE [Corynebacterium sp. 13CS0277]PRQ11530.1 UDP-glucose 4-epimerase GalE [Corynebacterium sp. 13CS0277]